MIPLSGRSLFAEAQARVVKSALCAQGYPRRALALLPEDGSQGSRELLLALAWLLARGPLLEQLLERARVRLGDELCVCQVGAVPANPAQDSALPGSPLSPSGHRASFSPLTALCGGRVGNVWPYPLSSVRSRPAPAHLPAVWMQMAPWTSASCSG